ncbi:MAG TPA: DUF456 family protein [Thermoanaerobaculaceae bacterium]|nr:DUF456 family protein [Thermoanaerobaculaceae bacterium]HPS76779.1 DUF456 family protein [Thermoanaerobaculaceae bacterium]
MTLLWVLAVILVLVGIAGTVLPALPGAPLVFVGLLLAAWADRFERVGWLPLTVIAALVVLALVVDAAASAFGATKVGASKRALLGAAVGTLVGLFFGLPGLLAGPFAGAAAGEMWARRDWRQAGRVGIATWVGLLLGSVAKLGLVFTMVAVFVTAYLL